jgi:hypothetical protein
MSIEENLALDPVEINHETVRKQGRVVFAMFAKRFPEREARAQVPACM